MLGRTRVGQLALALIVSLWFASPGLAQQATLQEAPAEASLQLATIFADHMVLQRDQPIPIWGTATPASLVRVQLGSKTREATAGADGAWRVDMGPLSAGGPLEMKIWTDGATLHVTDILVGEVWIASGQSNMQWTIANSDDAAAEIAASDWPQIRHVNVPRQPAATPQDSFESYGWFPCEPVHIKNFSAVAYFFGRELHKNLNVPIGLIGTNYGGTPMEAWTSLEALASRPAFAAAAKHAAALHDGKGQMAKNRPSGLFNAMVHPLVPYGIRGVIWYQGEANAGRHEHYRELSELMITDWRQRWGQGDFPFLLVQLAAWKPDVKTWPYLREAQLQTIQTVPYTGMAVTTDVGDRADIHPRNKQAVGKRLALAARALAYGEDIEYSGPIYEQMDTKGKSAYLSFAHVGAGLVARAGTLRGFTIAGSDREFVPATAKIEGDQIIVSSDQVTAPVAVRYNWSTWTEGNLYNAEGLPASPFRTDRF
ncbi:MAG: sialate O-acetylesterase [Bythopirellula sp.]